MRKRKDIQAIRVAMIRKNINGAGLARRLGLDRTAIYHVIAGRSVSRRIGLALIEAGVPARLLPEYAPTDNHLKPTGTHD